jgi:hypothetical protein
LYEGLFVHRPRIVAVLSFTRGLERLTCVAGEPEEIDEGSEIRGLPAVGE